MFNWTHPEILLGLLLLLPAGWFSWKSSLKEKKARESFLSPSALSKMRLSGDEKNKRIRQVLLLLSLFFLLFALAGPRQGSPRKNRGMDRISIVFDVSRSMLAKDAGERTRLERAQEGLDNLLDSIDGYKVALTAFAKEARNLVPLTLDLRAVRTLGERLKTGELSPGSDLEKALRLGAERLKNEEGGIIFLFTDGEELSGHLENVLPDLKRMKIKVIACGYGGTEGSNLPGESDMWGNPTIHRFKEEVVVSRLNRSLLEKLARETGGSYFENPRPDSLPKILEKPASPREEDDVKVLYLVPAFLAFLALLLSSFDLSARPRFEIPFFLSLLFFLGGWTPIDLVRNAAALRFARENRWEEAKTQLEVGLKASSDNRLLYNYGCVLYQLGDFGKAEKIFRQAEKKAPRDPKIAYSLGNCLYRLAEKKEKEKSWKAAIAEYKKAIALDPRDEDARFNLALAENKLKKKKEEKKTNEIGEAEVNEALAILEQDERQRQSQASLKPSEELNDPLPKLKDLWSPTEPDW
ncbi:MAG TPA: hypothetical protein DD435_02240 [Cyanobacteria bacterium UBA8530]|nr:hypothetical protein [Cyanobacteria bacterium UBA8530]